MKKIALTALVLITPMFPKPSMVKRAYHVGAGTTSLGLMALATLGSIDCANMGYKKIIDEYYAIKHPKVAIAAYTGFLFAGALGTWKLGSLMLSSFKKAFASSDLLEVTRDNYTSTVIEGDKPCILAILPNVTELRNNACGTLETMQRELPQYTFGTIELHEATDILGIEKPGVVFIKDGNLLSNKEGIYNEIQLKSIISRVL